MDIKPNIKMMLHIFWAFSVESWGDGVVQLHPGEADRHPEPHSGATEAP